jgi:hypothetical protein
VLKVVPSISNAVHLYHNFTVFAHIDNHLYHFCDNCITFDILFANFNHLADLAAILAPRNAHATMTAHVHAVATATITVMIISAKISHASFAFSSLRSQKPYHTISLYMSAFLPFAHHHLSTNIEANELRIMSFIHQYFNSSFILFRDFL